MEEKVRHASSDLYRTETIVPLAIAVTYAWLYGGEGSTPRDVPWWMWWIPAAIAAFGAWRQRLRYNSLWGYHYYLQGIEREIYGPPPSGGPASRSHSELQRGASPPYGWQTYWLRTVSPRRRWWKWEVSPHGLMRITFWIMLIFATFALAVQETIRCWDGCDPASRGGFTFTFSP